MGIDVRAPIETGFRRVLTEEALAFVARLHTEFEPTRRELLRRRQETQERIDEGEMPAFLPGTQREDRGWRVAPVPDDLRDRRIEITGPTDRKMIINALNSGARVFMADLEDANAPFWHNMVEGQANLIDAVARTIEYTNPEQKKYRLADEVATLMVRPRGWHLDEKHVLVDGHPVSGSLFDFGLYVFHNAHRLLERGSGPYFYLPKLENHLEARLWNDAFDYAEDALKLQRGTIKATVLIETILAAFEMDEILYELRDHSAGLNAGRWDYIFSVIKKFRASDGFLLPDRAQLTMTVPFMRAYTELLVQTCHRRGAHAIGGMAAFIPSRSDPEVNEVALAKVREDKLREAGDGFDGSWIAHPGLVDTARAPFDDALGERRDQRDRQRDEVSVTAADLLDFTVPEGSITRDGLSSDVSVAIRYLASWLRKDGAVAIFNLMEDTATAEIARSQVWQWVNHGATLDDGRSVELDLVRSLEREELDGIRGELGVEAYRAGRFDDASALFEDVALTPRFVDFLTLPGSRYVD